MKNIARIFLLFVLLLLSACVLPRASSLQPTETVTLTVSATVTVTASLTVTPSVTPSLTGTASPSATVSPTASTLPTETGTPGPSVTPKDTRTPVPSPLTPLPTFDPTKIVTITPQAKVACPAENPDVAANFAQDTFIEPKAMLAYVNAGGALAILEEQPNILGQQGSVIDLTGDGVKELIFSAERFAFYRCKDGTYQKDPFEFGIESQASAEIIEIVDLNQNGIPEIFFASFGRDGVASVYIYEWDGIRFRSLIRVQPDVFDIATSGFVTTQSQYDIVDTNGDGLKEVVLVNDVGAMHTEGLPFRNQTIILSWDGGHYVNLRPADYGPPRFRFEAVQDADRQVLLGNYPQAMTLYQQVISSNDLDWWSDERRDYVVRTYYNPDIVLPTPVVSTIERQQLSAYAYYRMVILHMYLGQRSAAQTKYATLRQQFPIGNAGYPYVEMARTFLNSYQISQNFQSSCVDVVAHVEKDPEILTPLGDSTRGWVNHHYRAEDTCPRLAKRDN